VVDILRAGSDGDDSVCAARELRDGTAGGMAGGTITSVFMVIAHDGATGVGSLGTSPPRTSGARDIPKPGN
jgi:hypothetical protein